VSPFVFLDRDGTLVHDRGYTHRIEDYRLLPGVPDGLARLAGAGFRLAIVTNQSGIGRGYFSEAQYERFAAHLEADLASRGSRIERTYFCPHLPEEGCDCRKPAPGLLWRARCELGARLDQSWVIGNGVADIGLAERAGCRGAVWVYPQDEPPDPHRFPGVPRARDVREAAGIILARNQGAP
jgi:D-glycero-D-manno-heptose 1,7-bisphosphate phosphatase